jgi:hypothetical protein
MVQLCAICQGKNYKRLAVQLEGGEGEVGWRRIKRREVVYNHTRWKS